MKDNSTSDLWAVVAPPPSLTPSTICLTPTTSQDTGQDLWSEPAPPPSPTPSSLVLDSPSTLSLTHHANLSPLINSLPTPWFISPIYQSADNLSPLLNDTFTYIPKNHFLNDLPQNLTLMNDTYIPYNYYKL